MSKNSKEVDVSSLNKYLPDPVISGKGYQRYVYPQTGEM